MLRNKHSTPSRPTAVAALAAAVPLRAGWRARRGVALLQEGPPLARVLLVPRLVRFVHLDSPVAADENALGVPECVRFPFLQVLLDVLVRAA